MVVVARWTVGSSAHAVGETRVMPWVLLSGMMLGGVRGACGWRLACSAGRWLVGSIWCGVSFGWWLPRHGCDAGVVFRPWRWFGGWAVCGLAVLLVGGWRLVRLAGVRLGSLQPGRCSWVSGSVLWGCLVVIWFPAVLVS